MSDNSSGQANRQVSKMDWTYLMNAKFLPEDLERMVSKAEASDNVQHVLRLDGNTAERFRDELTTRLARVGFGPDYEPTREGRALEDLIDRLAK